MPKVHIYSCANLQGAYRTRLGNMLCLLQWIDARPTCLPTLQDQWFDMRIHKFAGASEKNHAKSTQGNLYICRIVDSNCIKNMIGFLYFLLCTVWNIVFYKNKYFTIFERIRLFFVTLGRLLSKVLRCERSCSRAFGGMYSIPTTPVSPNLCHNVTRSPYDSPLYAILMAVPCEIARTVIFVWRVEVSYETLVAIMSIVNKFQVKFCSTDWQYLAAMYYCFYVNGHFRTE